MQASLCAHKISAEVGSTSFVDRHVHERIIFHHVYETREVREADQLDTQDPVHLHCRFH